MIYLNLKGGLGNQLFQLGAAYRLAKGSIEQIRLVDIELSETQKTKLQAVLPSEVLPRGAAILTLEELKSSGKLLLITDPPEGPFSDQQLLDLPIRDESVSLFLNGYFQTGKNISSLCDAIDRCPASVRGSEPANKVDQEKVLIHYRQGDYLRPDVQRELGLIRMAYLDTAISALENKYASFEIFSDAVGILERYGKKSNVTISTELDDLKVYSALRNASTLVIPNSTFSLTAAYLSRQLRLLVRTARWSRKYPHDELTSHLRCKQFIISNTFYSVN
jgi:hypothetical protein